MAHTLVATVDGFTGAGISVQALVIDDIREFHFDVERKMLKLIDSNGKVTDIAVSSAATGTLTFTGTFLSALAIAD